MAGNSGTATTKIPDPHAGLKAETSMLVSWLKPACGLMVETSMLVSWLSPDGPMVETSMLDSRLRPATGLMVETRLVSRLRFLMGGF